MRLAGRATGPLFINLLTFSLPDSFRAKNPLPTQFFCRMYHLRTVAEDLFLLSASSLSLSPIRKLIVEEF